jgi:ABC-type dipeptide/oligopeptide/nickel transport system permease subunit
MMLFSPTEIVIGLLVCGLLGLFLRFIDPFIDFITDALLAIMVAVLILFFTGCVGSLAIKAYNSFPIEKAQP